MAAKLPRYKRALIRHHFGDDLNMDQNLVDTTMRLIYQCARLTDDEDPITRQGATKKLRMIAEFCIAGQFYLGDQKPKATRPRGTILDGNGEKFSLAGSIKALRVRHGEASAGELWPHFIAVLDERGLNPTETIVITSQQKKLPAVEFDVPTSKKHPDGRRVIKMDAFRAEHANQQKA